MHERELVAGAGSTPVASAQQTVERERAIAFSRILGTLLQRQEFYVPLTGTYLLPQFYKRLQAVDGHGINVNTLRAYLLGNIFPSDRKVRLIADALGLSRGVLLFAAGYLKPEDLPDYPGPNTTFAAIESDIGELEQLSLSVEAKGRILRGLRNTGRILRLLNADRTQAECRVDPDERELLIEQMIDLWESPAPAPLEPNLSEQGDGDAPARTRESSGEAQASYSANRLLHPEPIASAERDGAHHGLAGGTGGT